MWLTFMKKNRGKMVAKTAVFVDQFISCLSKLTDGPAVSAILLFGEKEVHSSKKLRQKLRKDGVQPFLRCEECQESSFVGVQIWLFVLICVLKLFI